tara:strand:- start:44 stop:472 length:429 start_codon:yes stop_codon:yes gene_type:complete
MEFKKINDYLNLNNIFVGKTDDDLNKPKLVQNTTRFFFNSILKECNKVKESNYNLVYNISMFIIFILILGTILFYKYKGNKTKEERYNQNLKDKQYIMSKLVYYNRQNLENNQRIKNNMITNLPDYSNHPEANILHKNIYFN